MKWEKIKYIFEEKEEYGKRPYIRHPFDDEYDEDILKPRVGEKKECYRYNHYCGDNNHIKLDKVKKKYDPDFVQPSDVLEFNVVPNRKGKLHPTQKPEDLLEYLIKTYTNVGDFILDPTMGSGSTGIATLNTGRKFIGIEKDKNYFSIAKNRIEDFLAEKEKENKPCL